MGRATGSSLLLRSVLRRLPFLASVLVGFVALSSGAASASSYSATDLGTLPGGNFSTANAVNDLGQVVGVSGPSLCGYTCFQAFSYTRSGGMVALGEPYWSDASLTATAVNDFGQIVVDLQVDGATAGAFSVLPSGVSVGLSCSGMFCYANGVNNLGEVVGTSGYIYVNGYQHAERAFSYTPSGGAVDLGSLPGPPPTGGNSSAQGVNDFGEVVGWSTTANGLYENRHAFSYTPSGGMVDLSTLPGGTNSQATAVNGLGQIVGWSSTSTGAQHAFSYTPSDKRMVDLGTLPGDSTSQATAVNEFGQIVGTSISANGTQHAFVYTRLGGMVALGALPGGSSSQANGINNLGQIVGASSTAGGNSYAVLWQPGGPHKP